MYQRKINLSLFKQTLRKGPDEVKSLLRRAKISFNETQIFEQVHCQPEKGYKVQENGFYQAYIHSSTGLNRYTIFPKGKNLKKTLS